LSTSLQENKGPTKKWLALIVLRNSFDSFSCHFKFLRRILSNLEQILDFFLLCEYYREEKILKQIGSNIRRVHKSKNISQENLANECEMDYSQVNRMELGKVNFSISYLFRIAKALGVSPEHLIDMHPKK
jgi:DNA-binding Xre family transcriptional regulator